MKFERDKNATDKLTTYINESENLWNLTKVNNIIACFHEISLNSVKKS